MRVIRLQLHLYFEQLCVDLHRLKKFLETDVLHQICTGCKSLPLNFIQYLGSRRWAAEVRIKCI